MATEGYPAEWAKLILQVNTKTGEYHAIGGDREPGEGDCAYPGLEALKRHAMSRSPAKAHAPLRGLVEVRMTVERMRHEITQCIPDMTGQLAASVEAAVTAAATGFDFDTCVRREAERIIAEKAQYIAISEIEEALRRPAMRERLQVAVRNALDNELSERRGR